MSPRSTKTKLASSWELVLWRGKTHTMRVEISDMANDGAALGAASLVLHDAYAPNTADLVNV